MLFKEILNLRSTSEVLSFKRLFRSYFSFAKSFLKVAIINLLIITQTWIHGRKNVAKKKILYQLIIQSIPKVKLPFSRWRPVCPSTCHLLMTASTRYYYFNLQGNGTIQKRKGLIPAFEWRIFRSEYFNIFGHVDFDIPTSDCFFADYYQNQKVLQFVRHWIIISFPPVT